MNTCDLWEKTCFHLKSVLNNDVYTRWIEPIVPGTFHDNTFTIYLENDFSRDWIFKHYKEVITDALNFNNPDTSIVLQIKINPHQEEYVAPEPVIKTTNNRTREPQNHKTQLNPLLTFDNFVTGPSNSFAHATALGASEAPGRVYNPLFIYGQTGLGKTHLMQAVGHHTLKQPGTRVRYVSLETLLNEFVESIQKRTSSQFQAKYRNIDVLLVDDIQFLQNKERLQDEFFNIFNVLYDSHKQIILTSDLPPRELSGLEPRLVTRFEWGMVTEIDLPDFETRLAILRYKQSLTNMQLEDSIGTFIANNIKSNVRSLEGALIRVATFAKFNPTIPLNIAIVKDLLKDLLSAEQQKDLSMEEIQRAVVEHYGLRLGDMTSKKRSRSVAGPRQIAMFLCRKLTDFSTPEIAAAFNRTHGNVLYACSEIKNRMDMEPDINTAARDIINKLGRDTTVLS